MGKGDRKTKRGKITKGTYGVSRLKKKNKKRKNAATLVKSGRKRPVKRSTRKKTEVKKVAEIEKKQVETIAETTEEIKVEKVKKDKEIVEKYKPEKEKVEKEKTEKEIVEKDKAEKEIVEKDKVEKEIIEKDKPEKEKVEKDKAEQKSK